MMKSTVSGIEPQVGRWDYDGACSPAVSQRWGRHTFSVGVFCWGPRARGGGARRGKSVCRVSGRCDNPLLVYEVANRVCRMLRTRGTDAVPKSLTVGTLPCDRFMAGTAEEVQGG